MDRVNHFQEAAQKIPALIIEVAANDFTDRDTFYRKLEAAAMTKFGPDGLSALKPVWDELGMDLLDLLIVKWYEFLTETQKQRPGEELVPVIVEDLNAL